GHFTEGRNLGLRRGRLGGAVRLPGVGKGQLRPAPISAGLLLPRVAEIGPPALAARSGHVQVQARAVRELVGPLLGLGGFDLPHGEHGIFPLCTSADTMPGAWLARDLAGQYRTADAVYRGKAGRRLDGAGFIWTGSDANRRKR